MAASFALRVENQHVVAAVTDETLDRIDFVQDLHLRPFGTASAAKVLLLLAGGLGITLDGFVEVVYAPLDGVDGLAVIDVIVRSVRGALLAFSQLRPNVTRGCQLSLAGSNAAEEQDGTAIHLQQAFVAKFCANAVEVFQVHAHQIGKVVIAEGRMNDQRIHNEDVPRIDVGRVEERARD